MSRKDEERLRNLLVFNMPVTDEEMANAGPTLLYISGIVVVTLAIIGLVWWLIG